MGEELGSTELQVDVLIVGAGISGIGAAYHLQQQCPSKTLDKYNIKSPL
jgi:cation diffusion facilitator CzcD-associated flavoprotein CzcO